jgi:hypothetical protein
MLISGTRIFCAAGPKLRIEVAIDLAYDRMLA